MTDSNLDLILIWMTKPAYSISLTREAQIHCQKHLFIATPEVLNPDGKTLQFRYLSALAAKFIDNIRINIDNIRINVDDFPAKLVPLD